jgi:hypothetical protein
LKWKFETQVAWQTVAGEAVILDLSQNRALGLNAVGSFIWTHLELDDDEEIARKVAADYRIDPSAARRDVQAFLEAMRLRGLIAPAKV